MLIVIILLGGAAGAYLFFFKKELFSHLDTYKIEVMDKVEKKESSKNIEAEQKSSEKEKKEEGEESGEKEVKDKKSEKFPDAGVTEEVKIKEEKESDKGEEKVAEEKEEGSKEAKKEVAEEKEEPKAKQGKHKNKAEAETEEKREEAAKVHSGGNLVKCTTKIKGGKLYLIFKFDYDISEKQIESLDLPGKLVIDVVKTLKSVKKSEIKINKKDIKVVRFGKYPDKLRIVIESVDKNFPEYLIEYDSNTMIITI